MKKTLLQRICFLLISGVIFFALPAVAKAQSYKVIMLRDVSLYCAEGFQSDTCCLAYTNWNNDSTMDVLSGSFQTLQTLVIENPSKIIYDLPLNEFTQLTTIFLFGNDMDYMEELPDGLFNVASLKNLKIQMVGMPDYEKERLIEDLPDVDIEMDE